MNDAARAKMASNRSAKLNASKAAMAPRISQPFSIPTRRPNRNLVAQSRSLESDFDSDEPAGIAKSSPHVLHLGIAVLTAIPPLWLFRCSHSFAPLQIFLAVGGRPGCVTSSKEYHHMRAIEQLVEYVGEELRYCP